MEAKKKNDHASFQSILEKKLLYPTNINCALRCNRGMKRNKTAFESPIVKYVKIGAPLTALKELGFLEGKNVKAIADCKVQAGIPAQGQEQLVSSPAPGLIFYDTHFTYGVNEALTGSVIILKTSEVESSRQVWRGTCHCTLQGADLSPGDTQGSTQKAEGRARSL